MTQAINIRLTKRGNRIFIGKKPKSMSKSRYGILINYYDWHARGVDKPITLGSSPKSIKDLYYQFYEPLKNYGGFGLSNPTAYMRKKEVLINPVGELRAYRYFITDWGRRRLKELKKK